MSYPKLNIDCSKIHHNAKFLIETLALKNVSVTPVTKSCLGHPIIVHILVDAGASMLGDSRVENIQRMTHCGVAVSQAILALGRQDVCVAGLIAPYDMNILSSSSDHLILETSQKPLTVGTKVQFTLDYSAFLSAMSSNSMYKVFHNYNSRNSSRGSVFLESTS
ncbi:hypothetical protein BS333_18470 [Vibrio azureus]|uniref:Alanine racemase N-terminal domain-containing protein n=1 Tax=Vibrio azureus NBRC 104587 TaxID=1219077 RepID=U3AXH0_9VIBR|nr:hypothetical protein [Vibrio azureus]AUI88319.1 hypothetical protein BS333_18470 [Vibrio azureus]GAD77932.1 hypothetical protein VAZ01S_100_00080 [Vibrio azureus NBRC 104587]